MTIRVAINGFGRIGRNVLRAHYESGKKRDLEIVAINAPGDVNIHAHLLKFDTVHGRFAADVKTEGTDWMIVNGDRIRVFNTRDPKEIPWGDLGVDVVLECTGAFTARDKAMMHVEQGAKKVLISAPGKDADATVVYGVNDHILTKDMVIVSNASCTTNCLAPLVKPLHEAIGVERGLMTTVHSFTNDQNVTDVYHKDMRRARAAGMSQIPTKTGAAKAVGLVLPELNGLLDGFAVRVPIMKAAAEGTGLKGVLGYNDLPLVSSDFNHDDRSSIFDSTLTKVSGGRLVKVTSWYDNEWAFSCRMLDNALAMMAAQ